MKLLLLQLYGSVIRLGSSKYFMLKIGSDFVAKTRLKIANWNETKWFWWFLVCHLQRERCSGFMCLSASVLICNRVNALRLSGCVVPFQSETQWDLLFNETRQAVALCNIQNGQFICSEFEIDTIDFAILKSNSICSQNITNYWKLFE